MFSPGALTFQEFAMREPLPLATIQNAVLEFLRGRNDAVLFGAQAVNAYVSEPRMTQDVDLLSPRAKELADELRSYLSERCHIAVRIREIGKGQKGYRLFQIKKPANRHLVDIRSVEKIPSAKRIAQVLVVEPAELIASKVIAYHQRKGTPKSGTDWRDVAMLLLAFPELKRDSGPVVDRLNAASVDATVLSVWKELVAQEIRPADDNDI